jgi:hypothetical protein
LDGRIFGGRVKMKNQTNFKYNSVTVLKECKHCFKDLPVSNFYNHKNSYDGLQSWCKDCLNAYNAERKLKKICSTCGEKKLKKEFGKRARNKDGLQNQCKACFNKIQAEYIKKRKAESRAEAAKHFENLSAQSLFEPLDIITKDYEKRNVESPTVIANKRIEELKSDLSDCHKRISSQDIELVKLEKQNRDYENRIKQHSFDSAPDKSLQYLESNNSRLNEWNSKQSKTIKELQANIHTLEQRLLKEILK